MGETCAVHGMTCSGKLCGANPPPVEPSAAERERARAVFECYWGKDSGKCGGRLKCSDCTAAEKAARLLAEQRAAHERELAQAREERDTYDRALHSLTAGGSEFAHDAKACVAYVRRVHHEQHETIKRFKAERDAERDRATRLESALREAQDVARRDLERLAGVVDQRDRLEARVEELTAAHENRDNLIYKDWPAEQQVRHLEKRVEYWYEQFAKCSGLNEAALARVARLEGVLLYLEIAGPVRVIDRKPLCILCEARPHMDDCAIGNALAHPSVVAARGKS